MLGITRLAFLKFLPEKNGARDGEEEAAEEAPFRTLRAAGQGVRPNRHQLDQQRGQPGVETGNRHFEADGQQPVPSRMPAHDAPDVAGLEGPGAGEQGEEKRPQHDAPMLARAVVQEHEDDRGQRDAEPGVELAGDRGEEPTAKEDLLDARLHRKADQQEPDLQQGARRR